jgi:DNA-binding HxlR family transcriptional regulator
MRSYRQYCAAAKALDVVGDRWNLLIVRELLLRGACRYVDLLNGLPGIATNLLAERLRDLEHAGVVFREEAPPPIATTLYRLTPRGEGLRATLIELIRWGAELMQEPAEGDAFRSHWLAAPVRLYVADHAPDQRKVTIELRPRDQEPFTIEANAGHISARPGSAQQPDLVLAGSPRLILGVLTGRLEPDEAHALGLCFEGSVEILSRLTRPSGRVDLPASERAAVEQVWPM